MPHRRSKRAALWLTLALVLLLAGCWDRRELEERSNLLATGVDVCDEGEGCLQIATRQIAIPGRIPLGAGGMRREVDTVTVIRTPAAGGGDSRARAQAELNRPLEFGHVRLVIIGEGYARRGLAQYMDYLRRQPGLRRLMWLAIAEGRAEDVVKARPALEAVPALFLNDMFEDAVRGGRLPDVNVGNFLIRTSNRGDEAVAPLLRMAGPNQPELAGLAVFRGHRMVGKLTPEETATYLELQGVRKGGELLQVPLPGGHNASLFVYGRRTRYGVRWVRGRAKVSVGLVLETALVRLSPVLTGSDPQTLDLIQRRAEKVVEERAAALVTKLQQEYGADILAVGERIRAYLPGAWATIPDWPAAFARADFSFDIRVHVRQTGPSME